MTTTTKKLTDNTKLGYIHKFGIPRIYNQSLGILRMRHNVTHVGDLMAMDINKITHKGTRKAAYLAKQGIVYVRDKNKAPDTEDMFDRADKEEASAPEQADAPAKHEMTLVAWYTEQSKTEFRVMMSRRDAAKVVKDLMNEGIPAESIFVYDATRLPINPTMHTTVKDVSIG